jgi:hypothetical protein
VLLAILDCYHYPYTITTTQASPVLPCLCCITCATLCTDNASATGGTVPYSNALPYTYPEPGPPYRADSELQHTLSYTSCLLVLQARPVRQLQVCSMCQRVLHRSLHQLTARARCSCVCVSCRSASIWRWCSLLTQVQRALQWPERLYIPTHAARRLLCIS